MRAWFAPEDMRGGQKSSLQIDEAIRTHDEMGDVRFACFARMSHGKCLVELGDEEGGEKVLRRALGDALRVGVDQAIALCQFGLSYSLFARMPKAGPSV